MEFLRHPLYSILAVIIIGAIAGGLAHWSTRGSRTVRACLITVLAGIGAAFLGFHAAMLSNRMTGVILMPFAVALVISLGLSFALRDRAR
jgi:uncharacterized membrane protein YeaQ/YmgE (transglycosylase-associated protein family)